MALGEISCKNNKSKDAQMVLTRLEWMIRNWLWRFFFCVKWLAMEGENANGGDDGIRDSLWGKSVSTDEDNR